MRLLFYRKKLYKKGPFYKGYRGCGKLSDVLGFILNATNILICTGHFQRNLEMNKKAEYYKINESDWDGIWYPVGGRKGYDCCVGK